MKLILFGNHGRVWVDQLGRITKHTEKIKGEFIPLEHASRWLGQSLGITVRDGFLGKS
ncbi:hypothetical protein Hanom_Chr11g00981951 [Helianthus anomalus]